MSKSSKQKKQARECEGGVVYLAESERGAVLPFHLPAVIFGMSYQTPDKCIVCPCEEATVEDVSMTDESADAFHSDLSG